MKLFNRVVAPCALVVAAVATQTGCGRLGAGNSELNGYEEGQLRGLGEIPAPQYEKLSLTESNYDVVRVALFFTYDHDPYYGPRQSRQTGDFSPRGLNNGGPNYGGPNYGGPNYGGYGADQFAYGAYALVENGQQSSLDNGEKAFNYLRDLLSREGDDAWFDEIDQNGANANEVDADGQSKTWRVAGFANPLVGSTKKTRWEFVLKLGRAEDIARPFGVAMAQNNVALLNGHFYPMDADALHEEKVGDTSAKDPSYASVIPGLKSEIYGPAIEAFKAEAAKPENHLDYRIAGFNGCGSQEVERDFLNAAEEVEQGNMDIIGHKGRSNYLYFGQQLWGFLKVLVGEDRANWADALNKFKFTDGTEDEPSGFTKDVIPVLFNNKIRSLEDGV